MHRTKNDSQTFLRELDKKLWTAADKLRSNLDAAVYKHAVLGLIFLKYVSDSFAGTFRAWRVTSNSTYADAAGFSKSANLPDIISRGRILPPGRHVGAEDIEDDGEPFEETMSPLVTDLKSQFAASAKVETAIESNLKGLGYGF